MLAMHRLSHCHVFVLIWVSGLILFACIQTAWTLARGAGGVSGYTLCNRNLRDYKSHGFHSYSTECAMNEYDDWTTTTHAVCARYRPTASHSKVPHVRMSDVDSDSDGNLNDPEALVAQFNSINTAFFCPDDCIEKSSSSFASLESYIYDSICSVTSVEEHAWDLRDGQVGRHIVAARFIPAGSIVFSESPLIVAEATSFGERALRGEMAAAAVALLQLPAGAAARLPDCFRRRKDYQNVHVRTLRYGLSSSRWLLGLEM